MNLVTKLQPVWILLSCAVGVILGQHGGIAARASLLIEVFLMLLLFLVFLGVDLKEIRKSFLNFRFSATALVINFVWTPIFAFLLGRLLLAGQVDLQTGFLMLLVTPCTDWYLIFTGMAGGNVPLGSSVLPLNLILQVVLLPLYIWIFLGSAISFLPSRMILSIVLVLVVPLLLATLVSRLLSRTGPSRAQTFLSAAGGHLQLLFLCLAVACMFASQGGYLLENPLLFLRMLPPLLIFFAVNFALAMAVSRGMPFPDRISLLFTTSARNSPVSLAIATAAFPHRPLITLALVIGPLIELPVLALDTGILSAYRRRKAGNG